MTEITKKCFDILHEKMLTSDSYRLGYEYGRLNKNHLARLDVFALKVIRRFYISQNTQFSAGLARVCFEVMYNKQRGEAA